MKSKTRFTTRIDRVVLDLNNSSVGSEIPVNMGGESVTCRILRMSPDPVSMYYDVELEGYIDQELIKGKKVSVSINEEI